MSMYNMLFGRNPMSRLLLAMLDLTEADVGRFRDCYLQKGEDGKLRIVVYTRNGGGNREAYEEVTEKLQALPTYIRDWDDDFDCTYASYEFGVPEKFRPTAEELAALIDGPLEAPAEKWKKLLALLQAGKTDDPEVQKALEVGRNIFAQIDEQLKNGGGKVEV